MLKTVINNDLSEIKASKKALIDFNATWCGPCRMLSPIVDELADEYDGTVDFYSVDVDENGDAAAEFNITNIPALVLVKDGAEAARHVGFAPKDALKGFIDQN